VKVGERARDERKAHRFTNHPRRRLVRHHSTDRYSLPCSLIPLLHHLRMRQHRLPRSRSVEAAGKAFFPVAIVGGGWRRVGEVAAAVDEVGAEDEKGESDASSDHAAGDGCFSDRDQLRRESEGMRNGAPAVFVLPLDVEDACGLRRIV
jgi:hypothetical protein